ncbi:MAG: putative hemolysin [Planctomycetota bacterium]|jgi:putative hemolysin
MKRLIIIVLLVTLIGINLLGCNSSQRTELRGQNAQNLSREKQKWVGTPNPSAVYCTRLGYKYEIVADDEGNQYGLCILPDDNACMAWAFYRGKCGEEWSYCKRNGYDLRNLLQHEGWFRGAVCVDKTTKDEIGTVFDLFVGRFLSESLPEDTKR